jgi:hypothetical protein
LGVVLFESGQNRRATAAATIASHCSVNDTAIIADDVIAQENLGVARSERVGGGDFPLFATDDELHRRFFVGPANDGPEFTSDQIEDVFATLSEMCINVVENEEAETEEAD